MAVKTILIVDDETDIRRSLGGILRDEGFEVQEAVNGDGAFALIEEAMPDLVLLDIWMEGFEQGLDVLVRLREEYPYLPVVMISGHGNIETAVKATKIGAYDFIDKPLSYDKILLTINNAFNYLRLAEENLALKKKATKRYNLTGQSQPVQKLKQQIELVSPTNAWVLINGENGTGKEVVARTIHRLSRLAERPLVEVNCAAIPEELIESELFGHEKGAFTGASSRKRGKFDLANHGTLFLDEIGDMSLKTQAKILRILEEQKFERIGGIKTIHVEVRVIAATNKNLEQEIEKGNFRQDLFYRLNVIPLHVPPLRERKEDISLLIRDFIEDYARENGTERKAVTPRVIERLEAWNWPGNVRELKNTVERLLILSPGPVIESLDPVMGAAFGSLAPEVPGDIMAPRPFREAKADFERAFIKARLEEHGWNVTQTAEAIDMDRTSLHKKMKSLGLNEERE